MTAAILYVVVLMPYILLSYGDRYAAPLVPIKLILIVHALSFFIQPSSAAFPNASSNGITTPNLRLIGRQAPHQPILFVTKKHFTALPFIGIRKS